MANAKTDRTKFLILFGQVIFDNNFNYNNEVILNDKNITNSVIKLINEAFRDKIEDNEFFLTL